MEATVNFEMTVAIANLHYKYHDKSYKSATARRSRPNLNHT